MKILIIDDNVLSNRKMSGWSSSLVSYGAD